MTDPIKNIFKRLIITSLFLISAITIYKFTNQDFLNSVAANLLGHSKTNKIEIGAFVGTNPPTLEGIENIENISGQKLNSIMWFQGWDAKDQPGFPRSALNTITAGKANKASSVFHITWEPAVDLKDIINGTYDKYITVYAYDVKDWGGEIRFRFAHEMIQDNILNGEEYYRWQDQPEDYVKAFRHIHDIFKKAGATNAKFVWCPNNFPFDINLVKQYYPGTEYVDWLCMDGYNWGNNDGKPGWPEWLWFDDIFSNIYHTFVDHPEIFGDKPIMIGEFASCEASPHDLPGQNKAEWIKNAFERLASSDFDKIKAFHWFNINKECDWRIDSSASAKMAFKTALTH
jgi:hypothetical protein